MLSRKFKSLSFLVALSALAVSSTATVYAQEDKKEQKAESSECKKSDKIKKSDIGLEEMREHRLLLRDTLMVPSLKGIRGISYGIPGHNPFPKLDKVVDTRLKQLPIPVKKMCNLKSGDSKPVDAILQLKVLAAGSNTTVVELTVTQWSKLLRNPDIHYRAITYADQAVTHNSTVNDVAGKMINQFVLDYMKANNAEKKSKKG